MSFLFETVIQIAGGNIVLFEGLKAVKKELKTNVKSLSLSDKIVCAMGTKQIREELHQFINKADERILRLIYGMMKADLDEGGDYLLTDAHKQILNERLAAHESAPGEGSSWEKVKARTKKKE